MENHEYCMGLVKAGKLNEAFDFVRKIEKIENRTHNQNYSLGYYYFAIGNHDKSANFFHLAKQDQPENMDYRLKFAFSASFCQSHRFIAEARDEFSSIIESNEENVRNFLLNNNNVYENIVRRAALCCAHVGPADKAAKLYKMSVALSLSHDDYYNLSELSGRINFIDQAQNALIRASILSPNTYQDEKYKNTLNLLDKKSNVKKKYKIVKMHRYPDKSQQFHGDMRTLIKNHIANGFLNNNKLFDHNSNFFTMGSCFSRHVAQSLRDRNYNVTHVDVFDVFHTTFSNRYFIDWLKGSLKDDETGKRVREIMGGGYSREHIIDSIKNTNVFIMTVGVAPAFFDRETGDFILPRASILNYRALAEKYIFRTSSVSENTENMMYILSYIRELAPKSKIIITVSPIPLPVTFEFDSAIVADCLSKSVMRLTAHEIVHNSGIDDIYYWPSFEVFRWAGSNASPLYSADDGSALHVSSDAVCAVTDCFVDMLGA